MQSLSSSDDPLSLVIIWLLEELDLLCGFFCKDSSVDLSISASPNLDDRILKMLSFKELTSLSDSLSEANIFFRAFLKNDES